MASVSASKLVLFVASLVVAATVASTLTASVMDLDEALEGSGLAAADRIETDVEIVSDPGSNAVYNESTGNVTLLVKNTGEKDLYAEASQVDVLIDGEFATVDGFATPEADADAAWDTGEIVRITVSRSLDPGEHEITVHVDGAEDSLTIYL